MVRLFRAIFARIKAMFAADAALEIQAEIAARSAERKASLYRLAAQYDEEGLASVAHDLRRQAEALDLRASVNDVVPAIDDLIDDEAVPSTLAPLANTPPTTLTVPNHIDSKASAKPPARSRKR